MTGRADARRTHDVQPDVALLADRGLSGVQPHPNLQRHVFGPRMASKRSLSLHRAGYGFARAREGKEERVALGVDLAGAALAERVAEDAPLLAQNRGVTIPEPPAGARVEPSTSVKRKVTVPLGRASTGQSMECEPPGAGNEPLPPPARGQSS